MEKGFIFANQNGTVLAYSLLRIFFKKSIMTQIYIVDGMSTAACASKVKSALLGLTAITKAKVNHSSAVVEVKTMGWVPFSDVERAVHNAGNFTIQAMNSLVGQ